MQSKPSFWFNARKDFHMRDRPIWLKNTATIQPQAASGPLLHLASSGRHIPGPVEGYARDHVVVASIVVLAMSVYTGVLVLVAGSRLWKSPSISSAYSA